MGLISTYDIMNSNSAPYEIAISKGWVSGASLISIIGYNAVALANTRTDMAPNLQGIVTFPAAAGAVTVVSTSSADATGNVGTTVVNMWYLKDDYTEATASFNMNGVTPVTSGVSDVFRINRIRAASVGASGTSQGNISVKDTTGTYTYITMPSGNTSSKQAVYTVPYGKELYVKHLNLMCNSGSKLAQYNFYSISNYDDWIDATGNTWITHHQFTLQDNNYHLDLTTPTKFPQASTVRIVCSPSVTGGQAICAIRGWLQTV